MPRTKFKQRKRYRITEAGLQAKRRHAATVKPWRWATGPRTAEGKAIVSRNAIKHGQRCAAVEGQARTAAEVMAMVKAALGR